MIYRVMVLLAIVFDSATAVQPSSSGEDAASTSGSLFQCQSQNDRVYIPNIPRFYFSTITAGNFMRTETGRIIFTKPRMLCNGTISSIQYCYVATGAVGKQDIFRFLIIKQNHHTCTLDYDINVSSNIPPSDSTPSNCINMPPTSMPKLFCCATNDLQLHLYNMSSSYNYTFGISATNTNISLLCFKKSFAQYFFPQDSVPTNEFSFQVNDSIQRNFTFMKSPLLLLRFQIVVNPEEPSVPSVTTFQAIDESPPKETTEGEAVSMQPRTIPWPTTQDSAVHFNSNSEAVGVSMSVPIVVIIMAVTTVIVVVLVFKYRIKRIRTTKNVSYEGGNVHCEEYAESGPQVSSVPEPEYAKVQDTLEPYAECGAGYNKLREEENKKAYIVPAKGEEALYAQLEDIRTEYLHRNSVRLSSVLGSGQFGVVYRGALVNGEGEEVEVAVKTLKEGSGKEEKVKFLQEAAIMGQFKHHNVVTMYGVVTQGEPILLVLELLLKGDLRDHLLHMRSGEEGGDVSVDDHTLLSYCRQVASGMAYLSNKAFVHRDLAARNILVSDDDICKIADFGMSRDLADESYYVSRGGKIPVKWTAPEALHYKKYSTASDVWSFGALMYEIWSLGCKPFKDYTNNQVLGLVDSGYRLPPPPGCPRALYNIMIATWHPEPSQRPSFPEVTRQLSLPDPKLLKWSEEDKCVHPEAAKLGADLKFGQELYKDLQTQYQQ